MFQKTKLLENFCYRKRKSNKWFQCLLQDTEGSGVEEDKVDHTHEDDEDFDVASGDGNDDTMVDLTTDAPEDDKDEYYYDNKGTSDDEDDNLEGSGSGDGIVEETIGKSSKFYMWIRLVLCLMFFLMKRVVIWI